MTQTASITILEGRIPISILRSLTELLEIVTAKVTNILHLFHYQRETIWTTTTTRSDTKRLNIKTPVTPANMSKTVWYKCLLLPQTLWVTWSWPKGNLIKLCYLKLSNPYFHHHLPTVSAWSCLLILQGGADGPYYHGHIMLLSLWLIHSVPLRPRLASHVPHT